jgi:ANTAR domain-containing protein
MKDISSRTVQGSDTVLGAEEPQEDAGPAGAGLVIRRTAGGWQVGEHEVPDLTSAMVLADLFAPELAEGGPADGAQVDRARAEGPVGRGDEVARLRVTVAQLEYALAARVRVEQAIGVLAERHRLSPSEAFGLLRGVARANGRRVSELAGLVVDSVTNPLQMLPDELARPRQPRARGLSPRHIRAGEDVKPRF